MKQLTSGFIITLIAFTLLLTVVNTLRGDDELNHCLVKYKSEWGKSCTQCQEWSKSYRVYFKNTCDKKLDVKCAVQETDKRWRTFTKYNLLPQDTLVGYACKGTGKYMLWPREAGDNMVVFPGDDEINEKYPQ